LWLFWQLVDASSRLAVARARCAGHVVAACLSGGLRPAALEHAAAVLHELATPMAALDPAELAMNKQDIVVAGGIPQLAALLREGNGRAQRHAALVLGQLTERDDPTLAYEAQMRIAQAGAIDALVDWLLPARVVMRAERAQLATAVAPVGAAPQPLPVASAEVGGATAASAGDGRLGDAVVASAPPSSRLAVGDPTSLPTAPPIAPPPPPKATKSASKVESSSTSALSTVVRSALSTGPPELAARALSQIARRNKDTQATIAEEGAIAPLLAMLRLEVGAETARGGGGGRRSARGAAPDLHAVDHAVETRRWAAAAIAALADDNISTRIEIAEEGGIAPLVSLILAERESASYSRQAPLVVESAVHALYHLASDEDNKLAIARLGGIPPLVRLIELDDEGTDETMEWAAAALETLARGSHENQLALSRLEAIRPLTLLCGAEQPRTRAHAAGALLCIATPKENLTNVVVPLVELLELRNPAALAIAAHLLAALAARGVAGRTAVADAGGIPSLVRMLGDGTNPAQLQIDAAACLFDLARTPNGKSSLAAAGGVSPLVQMLSCASVDAQTHAAGALWLLATVPACQPTLVNAGSIEPLVALLSSQSVAAATHAADALGQLGSGSDNKAAIIKAGSVPPLVALLSASAHPEARESAAAVLAELSRGKKDGAREAIAKAGGVELLVQLLSTDSEPILVKHAAMALWGLTSEPALHGLVARAGAMPLLVALLQSDTHKGEVHGHAAATLSNVASDPTCRHLLTTQTNAMGVLMGLTQGGSAWLMSTATAILKQLDPKKSAKGEGGGEDDGAAAAAALLRKAQREKERCDAVPQYGPRLACQCSPRARPPLFPQERRDAAALNHRMKMKMEEEAAKSAKGTGGGGVPKGPPLSAKGPPLSAKGPPLSAKEPPLSAKGPPLSAKEPPLSAKGPPLSAKEPPLSAKEPPLSAKGPPLSAKEPPLSAKGPPLSAKGPPLSAKGPPLSAKELPLSAKEPPLSAKQPPKPNPTVLAAPLSTPVATIATTATSATAAVPSPSARLLAKPLAAMALSKLTRAPPLAVAAVVQRLDAAPPSDRHAPPSDRHGERATDRLGVSTDRRQGSTPLSQDSPRGVSTDRSTSSSVVMDPRRGSHSVATSPATSPQRGSHRKGGGMSTTVVGSLVTTKAAVLATATVLTAPAADAAVAAPSGDGAADEEPQGSSSRTSSKAPRLRLKLPAHAPPPPAAPSSPVNSQHYNSPAAPSQRSSSSPAPSVGNSSPAPSVGNSSPAPSQRNSSQLASQRSSSSSSSSSAVGPSTQRGALATIRDAREDAEEGATTTATGTEMASRGSAPSYRTKPSRTRVAGGGAALRG